MEFIDPNGDVMVPLRCGSCGDQIGVKSPGADMTNVVARCYGCAATEEAEAITDAGRKASMTVENDITVHGYPKCIPFEEFDKRILGRPRWELAEDNERLRAAMTTALEQMKRGAYVSAGASLEYALAAGKRSEPTPDNGR